MHPVGVNCDRREETVTMADCERCEEFEEVTDGD